VDVLLLFPHEVTVTPAVAGTLTIRAVGRRLELREDLNRRGEPVVLERTVVVEP